jgi:hypothetical protein
MKSIVELIYELQGMTDSDIAKRFRMPRSEVAYYRLLDFDNWLHRCLEPGRRFTGLDEA